MDCSNDNKPEHDSLRISVKKMKITHPPQRLNVVIAIDATASMGPIINGAVNVTKNILETCQLFEGVDLSLALFKDYDAVPDNGISIHRNLSGPDEVQRILGNVKASGGGRPNYEACCTALLKILDFIEPRTHIGTLIYIVTDEGARIFQEESSNSYSELKEELTCFENGRFTLEDCSPKAIAYKMNCKNAKVMVLSPMLSAFRLPGFCDLEMACGKINTSHPGIQLIHCPGEVAQLLNAMSYDITQNLVNMDTAENQSLLGPNVKTLDDVPSKCRELELPVEMLNTILNAAKKRTNPDSNLLLFESGTGNLKTSFLSFSIIPAPSTSDKYRMLMSDITVEKSDRFVIRILSQPGLLQLVAGSPFLGSLIRCFVDDHASKGQRIKYANKVKEASISTSGFAVQQVQRYKIVANELLASTVSACHDKCGTFSLLERVSLTVPVRELLSMTTSQALFWVEDRLLQKVRFHQPGELDGDISGKDVLLRIPAADFTGSNGDVVSPLQVMLTLVNDGVCFKRKRALSVFNLAALIVKNKNKTYPPQLIHLAREYLETFSYDNEFFGYPQIHSGYVRKLLLHTNVRQHLPSYVVNYLVVSLQISNVTISLKREETSFWFHHKVAVLEKRKDDEKKQCRKCSMWRYPECFNNQDPHPYCLYCSITNVDTAIKVTRDVHSILESFLPPLIEGKRAPITDTLCRRHGHGHNKPLSVRLQELNEPVTGCSVQLKCWQCASPYSVSNINIAPADEKSHCCPVCRCKKLVKEKNLRSILSNYVKEFLKRGDKISTNHLLNVDYLAYNYPHTVSADEQPEDEAIRNIQTLERWIEESNIPQMEEEDVQEEEDDKDGAGDVRIVMYWDEKRLRDLMTPCQMNELIKRQTGLTIPLVGLTWDSISIARSSFQYLQNIYPYDIRDYSHDEIDRINDEGTFITNTAAKDYVKTFLPEKESDLDTMLVLESCFICCSGENPSMYTHCQSIKVCGNCVIKLDSCPGCRCDLGSGNSNMRPVNLTQKNMNGMTRKKTTSTSTIPPPPPPTPVNDFEMECSYMNSGNGDGNSDGDDGGDYDDDDDDDDDDDYDDDDYDDNHVVHVSDF